MTKLPATPTQMVHSKLLNRKPIRCAVCDRYISTFAGLPVILDYKEQIIEFAHPVFAGMGNERPRYPKERGSERKTSFCKEDISMLPSTKELAPSTTNNQMLLA